MDLNKDDNSEASIARNIRLLSAFFFRILFLYGAMQASLFLRDHLHSQFVYTASWENVIRDECKSFKGCKSVAFERNSFFAEAGPSLVQILRPQVVVVYQFDRSVVSRSMASEFADTMQARNPNLFIKIN